MKNMWEILRQKETEIERVKKELQALRIVAPLLEEGLAAEAQVAVCPVRSYPTVLEAEPAVEVQVIPPPVRSYPTVQAKPAPAVVAAETKPRWP